MRALVSLGLAVSLLAPSQAVAGDVSPPYANARSTCEVNGFPIPSSPCPRTGNDVGSAGSADGRADAATGALRVDARATGTLPIARGSVAEAWSAVRAKIDAGSDGAVRIRLDDIVVDASASCPSCPLRTTGLQGATASLVLIVQIWRPGPGGPVWESETRCSMHGAVPATLVVPDGCSDADPLTVSAGTGRSVLVLLAARALASGGGSARATAGLSVSAITTP